MSLLPPSVRQPSAPGEPDLRAGASGRRVCPSTVLTPLAEPAPTGAVLGLLCDS